MMRLHWAPALIAAGLLAGLPSTASAKITAVVVDERCENAGGNEPGGQQPRCKGQGPEQITETENQNPSGKAPPGQNP
jgi:hypothetical protein